MTARHLLPVLALLAAASCGGSRSSHDHSDDMTFSPAPSTLLVGTVGTSFSQTISVTNGGTQPFVFTLTSAPPGLTLAAVDSFSATLSGTPTVTGVSVVRISVEDALNHTTFASYQFRTDQGVGSALTITPTTIPNAVKPQTYTQFFTVQNGVAPFTWTQSGSLPPNLVFHPTAGTSCDVSGVPVLSGSFSFTLNVTDSSVPPRSGSATIALTVQ